MRSSLGKIWYGRMIHPQSRFLFLGGFSNVPPARPPQELLLPPLLLGVGEPFYNESSFPYHDATPPPEPANARKANTPFLNPSFLRSYLRAPRCTSPLFGTAVPFPVKGVRELRISSLLRPCTLVPRRPDKNHEPQCLSLLLKSRPTRTLSFLLFPPTRSIGSPDCVLFSLHVPSSFLLVLFYHPPPLQV